MSDMQFDSLRNSEIVPNHRIRLQSSSVDEVDALQAKITQLETQMYNHKKKLRGVRDEFDQLQYHVAEVQVKFTAVAMMLDYKRRSQQHNKTRRYTLVVDKQKGGGATSIREQLLQLTR
ncbi:uncharacterized protein LOC142344082 [Convolutriloba macropyga]|uniref:uncharacterized protein LOC142344082 n=1 Tax=Convolutriloba macropyga TaxID=536237 RepID=UPI003F527E7C